MELELSKRPTIENYKWEQLQIFFNVAALQ